MVTNEKNNNATTSGEAELAFCRKCGNKLVPFMVACDKCGTAILQCEEEAVKSDVSFNDEEYKTSKLRLKKKRRRRFFVALIIVLAVAALSVVVFFASKFMVTPQDINAINGCPEFYDIKFGMTDDEVSKNIELEHTVLHAVEESPFFETDHLPKNSGILLEEGQIFELYGRQTEDVFLGFNGKYLEYVVFAFSKTEYSLNDIVELYEKIYGPATQVVDIAAMWEGTKTMIFVWDEEFEDGESKITVRYVPITNSQYEKLSFDGSELDPCGFLDKNYVFDNKPEYYISGLTEGEDYVKNTYSDPGFASFTQYTLFPMFEYMGIEEGYTGIQFTVDTGSDTIGIVSYTFLLNYKNSSDRMTYIYNQLWKTYGATTSSTYTPLSYSTTGIEDLTYPAIKKRIEHQTEGMYHIQWTHEGRRITLGLTIEADKEYCEGYVSFTD